MTIPTEPIGSIPRSPALLDALRARGGADPTLNPQVELAIRDTIERFEATSSPVITDGEQAKYHNFWTYCVQGLPTHSADVDHAELLPSLFEPMVGNFYVALAGERDRVRVLEIIRDHLKPDHRVFVGVVAPIDPRVETPEEIRDRVLEAASYIPLAQLGTTDDCGFAPFSDDTSTTRDTAFAKIRARVQGTAMAARILGADP